MTNTNIIKDFFEGKIKLWKSYWLVGELLNGIVLLIIFNLEIYFFNTNNSVSQIPFLDFTNLALSASALGTKYLNEIFTVTREVKDKVSGEIQTTADYSELGILLIVVTLLTLILPILFVIIINNSKYKTSE